MQWVFYFLCLGLYIGTLVRLRLLMSRARSMVYVVFVECVNGKARSYASYVLYFLTTRTHYNVLYFIIRMHMFGRKTQGLHYYNIVK